MQTAQARATMVRHGGGAAHPARPLCGPWEGLLGGAAVAATAVGTRAMLCCRVFRYKAARPAAVAPVALGTLSSVGFMNLNLKHNSVSFYQLSKIACIPLTLLFSYVLEGSAPSAPIMATLVPLGVGLGIAQAHDYEANTLGTAYAAISVVCTVLYQITTSSCQSKLSIDSNQLLYHTAPLITVGMLLMCPLFDDFAFITECALCPDELRAKFKLSGGDLDSTRPRRKCADQRPRR